MVEVVVEDLVAAFCVLHGEVVAGADEEEVPHYLTNHPLVQEPVVNVLPVCVLQDKASSKHSIYLAICNGNERKLNGYRLTTYSSAIIGLNICTNHL